MLGPPLRASIRTRLLFHTQLSKQGREELLTEAVERGSSNSSYLFKRSGQGCPLLRASSDRSGSKESSSRPCQSLFLTAARGPC